MKRVPLLAFALACAVARSVVGDEGGIRTGTYSVDGCAKDASRTSGTVVVASAQGRLRVERRFAVTPGGGAQLRTGTASSADGELTIDWDQGRGITGALGERTTARLARTVYRSDGRGGYVGRFVDGERTFEETLAPLAEATQAGTAPLDTRSVLERARDARARGLPDLRAFMDALVARGRLYSALDNANASERAELVKLARAVAPEDPASRENEPVLRELERLSKEPPTTPRFDLIVVPGFTPKKADRVHAIHETAAKRCRRAAADWKDGKAPFILATGGAVHPAGTPVIEALELKAELVRLGVPAERIYVETRARHSTTNLRNAGRFMLAHGMKRAIVVSGLGQSFYFSSPDISTFHMRSKDELGYEVGKLRPIDPNRTSFRPSERCVERNEDDPYDP